MKMLPATNGLLVQETHSLGLLLLFNSTSRSLLKYCCSYLKLLAVESEKNQESGPLHRSFREIDLMMLKAPVNIRLFEKVLAQVENSVRRTYQLFNTAEEARRTAEGQMLFHGEIPQVLTEPVKQILFPTLTSLREDIDEAYLYFFDFSHLGLRNDTFTRKRNSTHPVDVFTKLPLRKDIRARRCVRCCSHMEDNLPPPQRNPILHYMSRVCYCGGSWMMLDSYDADQAEL